MRAEPSTFATSSPLGDSEVEAEVERDDVVAVLGRVGEQAAEPYNAAGEPVELGADDPAGEAAAAAGERRLESGPLQRAAAVVEVFVPL